MSAVNKHLLSKLLVCRKLLNIKGKIEKTEFLALQELRSSAGREPGKPPTIYNTVVKKLNYTYLFCVHVCEHVHTTAYTLRQWTTQFAGVLSFCCVGPGYQTQSVRCLYQPRISLPPLMLRFKDHNRRKHRE